MTETRSKRVILGYLLPFFSHRANASAKGTEKGGDMGACMIGRTWRSQPELDMNSCL